MRVHKQKPMTVVIDWLLSTYTLPLNTSDQTQRTLLSSVIYLPGTKNNCFWSCDSYVGPHDSSIMAPSWKTQKKDKQQSEIFLWFDLFAFTCSSKPLKKSVSSTTNRETHNSTMQHKLRCVSRCHGATIHCSVACFLLLLMPLSLNLIGALLIYLY